MKKCGSKICKICDILSDNITDVVAGARPDWLVKALEEIEDSEGMRAEDVRVSKDGDYAWVMFDNYKDWTLYRTKEIMNKLIRGKKLHGNKIKTPVDRFDGPWMAEIEHD